MDWKTLIEQEKAKQYFQDIEAYLDTEDKNLHTTYPPKYQLLRALDSTPLNKVSVVILGQDPYHGPNEANGLAFSVPNNIKIPPSLRNIFKELENDIGFPPTSGDLSPWARQGVLLLNTSLSVRHKKPASHSHIGWQNFTDKVISTVSSQQAFVVFILWGEHAKSKQNLIDSRHAVITSAHPSPLSAYRGFFGSKPFSRTNKLLSDNGITPIQWY